MPKFSVLRMAGSEIIRTMGAMLLIILGGSQILDAGAVMTGGCRTFCGNITVDYPFGIEQGCGHPKYRDLVYCINNVMMFHVISGSYEVVNIDYGFKVLDIFDPKMSTCASMHKSDGFFLEEALSRYLQPTPDNAFMLLGCSKASPLSPLFEGFPDKHLPCRNVTEMGCDAFYDCPSWVGFGKKSRATRPPPCCGIPYSSIGTCVLGTCCCGSYRRAISSLEPCLNTRVISEESWELAMKPLYYGNIKYEARQTDIERLFGRYGRIDRVDMKSGILKSVQALPGDPVHILSSCHGSASIALFSKVDTQRTFCIFLMTLLHFIPPMPCHAMLSHQPGSSM